MARNFLSLPFGVYQGTLSGKPFNDSVGKKRAYVLANIFWGNYSVGIQPVGTLNPNFAVKVDLNSAGAQVVNQLWFPVSCYIDNQNVNFPVYVYFPDTQFVISCPANSAGWYKVFTLARAALISGIGISDLDIAAGAFTNVFFSDADMVPYLDEEAPTAVAQGIASPQINFGGSGGQILTITAQGAAGWYTNGNMSISGGGGINGASNAVLDSLGRINQIQVTNPGQNYSAVPLIAMLGAQNPPAFYNNSTVYTAGQFVQRLGQSYQALVNSVGHPPESSPAFWGNINIPIGAQYTFTATLSPITGGISFQNESNFGDRALGDNVYSNFFTVGNVGLQADNVFNSPYNSGFLWLTNIHIVQVGGNSTDNLVLEAAGGGTVLNFQGGPTNETLVDLQGCNLKLPANQDYRFRSVSHAAGSTNNTYNINISYTFNAINR